MEWCLLGEGSGLKKDFLCSVCWESEIYFGGTLVESHGIYFREALLFMLSLI